MDTLVPLDGEVSPSRFVSTSTDAGSGWRGRVGAVQFVQGPLGVELTFDVEGVVDPVYERFESCVECPEEGLAERPRPNLARATVGSSAITRSQSRPPYSRTDA